LVCAEDEKGTPLSRDEVLHIRDEAACIMMQLEDARKMDESRGYRDIDPTNCWFEWQKLRRELGRLPELDPGVRTNLVQHSSPEYQQTIREARASLDVFRSMLPTDGSPRWNAMVKTKLSHDETNVFMWLSHVRLSGENFLAEFFEVPAEFTAYEVGDRLEVTEDALTDWMINDDGTLHGGFSVRLIRATLPEDERSAYDEYIGVTRYA
jgi:uncharacterized protein YegJ (DUF2314 family)